MPPQPERIAEDLRGQIAGEVLSDELTRQLYANDASQYELKPVVVVRPRVTADVAATARYATKEGLPIHARGGASGTAGGCLGEGIVIDFSRYMRRILSNQKGFVTVQAGLIHAELNRKLFPSGQQFAPDPSTTEVTTLGGMAAVDASGSHRPAYGSMRDHVVGMKVVMADGVTIRLGQGPGKAIKRNKASEDKTSDRVEDPNRVMALSRSVGELVLSRQALIREQMPHGCANVSGYALDHILSGDSVSGPRREAKRQAEADLTQLLIGSEGTLGLITELTLKTTPLPKATSTLLLTFTSLDRAANAVQAILPLDVAACDLLDRRHIGLARELDPRYELLLSGAAEAILCIELIGEDESELNGKLHQLLQVVQNLGLTAEAFVAESEEDRVLYRDLRERFVATMHGLKGVRRAVTGVEAIALPPAALPQFFSRMQDILKRRQVTASVFGHVAHGQLHIRPLLDVTSPGDMRKLEALASDLYDTVWLLGGTMSGSYGDGLSRTPFASRQHGPLVNVFREVKRLFDPEGILNPGKVVPAPGGRMTRHTRPQRLGAYGGTAEDSLRDPAPLQSLERDVKGSAVSPAKSPPAESTTSDTNGDGPVGSLVDLQLSWSPEEILQASRSCNGCGACRSVEPGGRMCPVFRFSPREEASPRAKANLLRGVLTGRLEPGILLKEETKQVADLCVNCHMCRLDCPAEVDIPKLMLEAKAAYVKTNGLTISGSLSMRLDMVAWWLSMTPRLANRMFKTGWVRWMLEKTIGLAAGRKIPSISDRPYLKLAAGRRLHLPAGKAKKRKLKGESNEQDSNASPDNLSQIPAKIATQTKPTEKASEKVLYFVDTYANYFDTDLAIAFERVVRRHGVEFYAPTDQHHSGMSMISQGAVDVARKFAERNVSMLAEAVRQGYQIVATEPSAVLALTHEYLHLMPDDEDAALVAEHTQEACHYLWRRHLQSKLHLDMQPLPLRVAYHVPCHVRALGIGTPSENLLRLIPELRARRLDKGCSGMAGTFGLSRKNYRSSLRAGLPMLSALRTGEYQIGATECGACRTQMEQSSPIGTLHPIKLLAASYGVMPELYEELLALPKLTAETE